MQGCGNINNEPSSFSEDISFHAWPPSKPSNSTLVIQMSFLVGGCIFSKEWHFSNSFKDIQYDKQATPPNKFFNRLFTEQLANYCSLLCG